MLLQIMHFMTCFTIKKINLFSSRKYRIILGLVFFVHFTDAPLSFFLVVNQVQARQKIQKSSFNTWLPSQVMAVMDLDLTHQQNKRVNWKPRSCRLIPFWKPLVTHKQSVITTVPDLVNLFELHLIEMAIYVVHLLIGICWKLLAYILKLLKNEIITFSINCLTQTLK